MDLNLLARKQLFFPLLSPLKKKKSPWNLLNRSFEIKAIHGVYDTVKYFFFPLLVSLSSHSSIRSGATLPSFGRCVEPCTIVVNGWETTDVKSVYNLNITCSIYTDPPFRVWDRNDDWNACRQSLSSITYLITVGSSQKAALPQKLNLIRNQDRQQSLLLLSYAFSRRPVTVLRLA